MESPENSTAAKGFPRPSDGNAGVYVYRSGSFGGFHKRSIWIDGECLGRSAPNVFFYKEVKGNAAHKISTQSEFSQNDLTITTSAGKNYFVHQYIKFGALTAGADLELVEEGVGKSEVSKLDMATPAANGGSACD
jgi:hypothetical protein